MRILHTYCLNYNIGDYALGIGVKNLLRDNLNVEYIGETNIQGREFTKYYIEEVVNKRYDLLVIGGGGIIHGSHWPNGWFWLIDIELIKKIKIPFIVYGVGYNYWDKEAGIPEIGIRHLKETIKYAASFSVRNDGSYKRLLEHTGINASVAPDPGFHVNLNTDYRKCINSRYIIIQIANDKPKQRFGSIENQQKFIREMHEVTIKLAKTYKVIFAPHVPNDVSISYEIAKDIANVEVWNFSYFAFDHSKEAVGYYKYAEFAISMRGHGQIIPICFNTPVISLENHPKHRGLMEELGLLDYNINVRDVNFKENLLSLVDLLESQKENLSYKYELINSNLNEASKSIFSEIKSKIPNG